ncbi:MAG: hypothetical protein SGILL_004367, partial [Bacillariaceae sp.]
MSDDILLEMIQPTAELDTFYTNEVCPVEFPKMSPPFPKSCSKQARDIVQKEPRKMWEKYMNGDNFQVRIRREGKGSGYLAFHVSDNGDGPPLVMFAAVSVMGAIILSPQKIDPVLQGNVPDYLVQLLINRIAHWVLRQHISKIQSTAIEAMLFEYLMAYYADMNHWQDLYDIVVLRAKWILLAGTEAGDGNLPILHEALNKVGESLEALKKYDLAAGMYQVGSTMADSRETKYQLLQHSGLAFKRDGQFKEAEKTYLQSMSVFLEDTSASKFDPNKLNGFMNLLMLYAAWAHVVLDPITGSMSKSEVFDIQAPLYALLYFAGWQGDGEPGAVYLGKNASQSGLISPKMSQVKARKFLFRVLQIQDPAEFRKAVF